MDLVSELQKIVGRRHVLQGDAATRRFRLGIRYGGGAVLAVVQPGSLVEMWRVLQGCHRAGTVIICQAANTGLTGGSTPVAEGYDRPVVLINTLRLTLLALLRQGEQVISQPGVSLSQLETTLKPLGREPHSVIGSTCIGASVAGGVCNNSGGSLIRRGPAFTQLSLFARIDEAGQLQLVNHLGMDLGDTPEEILGRLDEGRFDDSVVQDPAGAMASDREYSSHVRDVGSATPARYNADPRRLYEASGSAGKIAVFALRLDTFPADRNTQVFYIGSNRAADLETIRRHILVNFTALPIAGEYMHRTAYELSRTYGKDLFLFIQRCGAQRVPQAFAWKTRFDALTERLGLGAQLGDRLLQRLAAPLPEHLPPRLNAFAARFEHHLLLKMGEDGIDEARAYLQSWLPTTDADFIECDAAEGNAAFLNRFSVGNAMNRYRAVHRDTVEDILALDIALPRNTQDWFETLPSELAEQIEVSMYCGHFFCHVLHQEYLVKKGRDCAALKQSLLNLLDARGARYPAEHNVGHLYDAAPELEQHYRQLDPTNAFNPGIGRLTRSYRWRDDCCAKHPENTIAAAATAARAEQKTQT